MDKRERNHIQLPVLPFPEVPGGGDGEGGGEDGQPQGSKGPPAHKAPK